MIRGRPDLFSSGRYFFAPDTTPFYAGWHLYGSSDWTSDERREPDYLGQDVDRPRKYYSGRAPIPLPSPLLIGSADCVANGEVLDLPLEPEPTPFGWPLIRVVASRASNTEIIGRVESDAVYFDWPTADSLAVNRLKVQSEEFSGDLPYKWGTGFVNGVEVAPIRSIENWTNGPPPYGRFGWGDEEWGPDGVAQAELFWTHQQPIPLPPIPLPPLPPFPAGCYAAVDNPQTSLGNFPDIADSRWWTALADVIDLQYADPNAAALLLASMLPGATIESVVPANLATFPSTVIVRNLDCVVMTVTGTAGFQQLATQFAYAGFGLDHGGMYRTNNLWFLLRQELANRLAAAGVDNITPLVLAGHSYGGAGCTVLAADIGLANPTQVIQLITYGMPIPGDSRLAVILEPVRRVHLANRGDWVPGIPPTLLHMGGWSIGIPGSLLSQWTQSAPVGNQVIIDPDGVITYDDRSTIDMADIITFVGLVPLALPLPTIAAHPISVYAARLGIQFPWQ